jgi:hypothetical protein
MATNQLKCSHDPLSLDKIIGNKAVVYFSARLGFSSATAWH